MCCSSQYRSAAILGLMVGNTGETTITYTQQP
uniref:Uncharacterized protein n=1 Tax=Anguilla anguilla TaxID=7936 RepID=A0A0E9RJY3_ANGAN